jgi:D-sedoheptulose 7-phosphate isomerase
MHTRIQNSIRSSVETKIAILNDTGILETIEAIAAGWVACFKQGGKILLCGNGGSAADAQHIAAELSGRYYYDRPPLYAEALHVNTSYLTAVGNDYGFESVFSRMVEACGKPGDWLVALSTSGNSGNVVAAIETARRLEMTVVGLTGAETSRMTTLCHHLIRVPSTDTPRIQEAHLMIGHILCQITEATLFPAP